MSAPVQPGQRAVVGVVVRAIWCFPWLWSTAVVEAFRLAAPGWWRKWPPLPYPDTQLWHFRMETAYGGAGDAVPDPVDVRSFLTWCRDMRRWRRQ